MDAELYDEAFYNKIDKGSYRSAVAIVPHLRRLFPDADSIVDFGCGNGTWLAVCLDTGFKRIKGIDFGSGVDAARLRQHNWYLNRDLSEPIDVGRFDICISLEVAEHIAPDHERIFVANLCAAADIVVFSAAIPHQGGDHHVNEQPLKHWIALFHERGYECFDVLRPQLWRDQQIEWWYRQNVVVFVHSRAVGRYPHLRSLPSLVGLDVVHPDAFEFHVRIRDER